MREPTIQIITRSPGAFEPGPDSELAKYMIFRDPSGKIQWLEEEPIPILRYPNSKVVDKPDAPIDKYMSQTREGLVSIRNEEMEKGIRDLDSDSSDEEEPDTTELAKPKGKKSKKARAKAKRKEKKEAVKQGRSYAEIVRDKFEEQRKMKAEKSEDIKAKHPPNTAKDMVDDMKRLARFVNRNIKRYNKHEPPMSPEMKNEIFKYEVEKQYKHLQHSFIDWDLEGPKSVCRSMDLPCYGRNFGHDIEEHLHAQEHKNYDRSMKGKLPLAIQLDRVKREVKNGLSYKEGILSEQQLDPY
ncbi:hypothetical protein IL306_012827 [Fusarium sp. DS 682]|nr:hypothetical protein IL306_012827 [Fusarium sp. DS 682]